MVIISLRFVEWVLDKMSEADVGFYSMLPPLLLEKQTNSILQFQRSLCTKQQYDDR